jgi:hypothetical protein
MPHETETGLALYERTRCQASRPDCSLLNAAVKTSNLEMKNVYAVCSML